MKHIAIVIDWYGPYWERRSASLAGGDFGPGLYMALGKCAFERTKRLQYVGTTKKLNVRLARQHDKLDLITKEHEYWLGEVGSVGIPGRKAKVTDRRLDLAEWAHSHFLKLPLNERKRTLPDGPVTVLNRWWRTDYETPWIHRPCSLWPDLIDYRGWSYGAHIAWLGGRRIRVNTSAAK